MKWVRLLLEEKRPVYSSEYFENWFLIMFQVRVCKKPVVTILSTGIVDLYSDIGSTSYDLNVGWGGIFDTKDRLFKRR